MNYIVKEEELRSELNLFLHDQTQLAKIFRRDVEELKRMQQEHLSKLDMHRNLSSFDELIEQQIKKYYHSKQIDDDEEEEEEHHLDDEQKLIERFNHLHEEHVIWLKKQKKNAKILGTRVERLRMSHPFVLFSIISFAILEEIYEYLPVIENK